MAATWWRSELDPEGLSQGDVTSPLPVAVSVTPPKRLAKGTGRGGVEIWTSSVDTSKKNFLFEGAEAPVLVVSHSCDLDKHERRGRVLVAPMRSVEALTPDVRASVMNQERIALMPLPDVPGLGSHYADLRLISPLPIELINEDVRIASMSTEGLERLQVQLVKFFTRISQEAVEQLLGEKVAE